MLGSYNPSEEDIENPCMICKEIFDGVNEMGKCSKCMSWFHKTCEPENKMPRKGDWHCSKCKTEMARANTSSEVRDAAQQKEIEDLKRILGEQALAIKRLSENLMQKETETGERLDKNRKAGTSSAEDLNPWQIGKILAQQEMRDLPIFDGSGTNWASFYRSYEDSKDLFTSAANRNRLLKALKGKALESVSGLLVNPDTIAEAMRLLKFRYGQTESIIQRSIDEVFKIDAPTEKKPSTIVDYAMKVVSITANLKAVGEKEEMANPMLIKRLAERLPQGLQLKWIRKKKSEQEEGEDITVKMFSEWLLKCSEDYLDLISFNAPEDVKTRKAAVNVHKTVENKCEQQKENNNKESKMESGHKKKCTKCQSERHILSECAEFEKLDVKDRVNFLRKMGICFVCLKRGHMWRKCYQKNSSGQRIFHRLVKGYKPEPRENEKRDVTDNKETQITMTHSKTANVIFKIIPVILYGPRVQISTYALIDECASTTLLEEDVASQLQLTGPTAPLLMGWTNDITNLDETSRKVKLAISGTSENDKKYNIKNVRTIKKLSLPSQEINVNKIQEKYSYLKHLDLRELKSAKPTILIGLDNTNLIATIETRKDLREEGPVATLTKLGWTIHGPESHFHSHQNEVHHTLLHCECNEIEENKISTLMENYFAMEDLGVKITNTQIDTVENKRALRILKDTTKRVDNGFVTGLLWNKDVINMPNNYEMCLRRLISIESKMSKNDEFKREYHSKIFEYVNKGFARKLDVKELENIKHNMWLLPHFGTSTPSKPKLRLVFDAKATFKGISLNSELLTGPDQYNNLIGVIYKFRKGRVAVSADIKDMFHRIMIRKEDQPFQCFLWRNGETDRKPDVYVMEVMIFGAKCSPCSAQYVRNQNALDFQDKYPRAVESITNNFYVDDYMESFDSESEALKITREVIEISSKGNFELRRVLSNSKSIRDKLGDKQSDVVNLMKASEPSSMEKVLGLYWNINTDELMFKIQHMNAEENTVEQKPRYTKREILRLLMRIFDPLGLLAHYTIRAKIILQEVWMRKEIEWDTILPKDLEDRWREWMDNLKGVTELRIPRNYSPFLLKANGVQLHVFTDASERAYATVAYMRINSNDGVEVKQIGGKSKISSQKTNKILSMPRQELQGALLGARFAAFIEKEHAQPFEKIYFWTDSQTVLAWIKNEYGSYKPFVAHRIAEILENSNSRQWRYISTKLNPADDATKCTKTNPFDKTNRWFSGPSFLQEPECTWPMQPSQFEIKADDPEIRRIFVTTNIQKQRNKKIDYSPIDPEKFSDWHRMLRTTSWIQRCIYNLNKHLRNEETQRGPLLIQEIDEATKYFIKKCQIQSYPEEVKAIRKGESVPLNSKIKDLIPILDEEGIMRMESRVELSPIISKDARRPIILHPKHKVTQLLLDDYHRKYKHQFQELIVNEVRQKYWIPQLRVAVKRAKARCQRCKNQNAVPTVPKMAKLPLARLNAFQGCFHHCGVDLFGPMQVTVKRSLEKRWGVVYTCLTTRGIYLDVVPDLSADALIMSIRNCNARRGPIHHLYSDCGTNFKGAKRLLDEAVDEVTIERIHNDCVRQRIQFHFNPPASPHMGGCWERMVRSIKNVLAVILKEKHPRDNTLRSLLCEVEDIINKRPLTYIALEKDSDDVLTPKHFINPYYRNESNLPGNFNENDMLSRKQWRQVQEMSNQFWKRWVVEYTPMITRTTKWHVKVDPLKVGDVVIICDKTAPRNTWDKGRIVSTNISKDGQVRSASVQTCNGILVRPTVKLAKLDVESKILETNTCNATNIVDNNREEKDSQEKPQETVRITRSKSKGTKIRGNISSILMTMCVCILAIPSASAAVNKYEIHFPREGLYIERLGQAYVRRGNFRIEVSMPLNELEKDANRSESIINDFNTMCNHVEQHFKNTQCKSYLTHLKRQLKETSTEMENIISIKARAKRGLLGKTLTAIFGVNEEVYQDIDQLSKNQETLLQTVKHQNLLLCSRINEKNHDLERKLDIFNKRLQEGLQFVRYMDKWNSAVDEGMLELHVHSAYLSAENFCNEVQRKYERYSSIVHQRGNILDFLSFKEIKDIIKNATQKMSTDLQIHPIPKHEIKLEKTDNELRVWGYFHILEIDTYELLHITPIPQKLHDRTYKSFESKVWTMAVNYNRKSYFELNESQKGQCYKESGIYVCSPILISDMNTNPNCLLDEIYDRIPKLPCPVVQFSINTTVWKHLAMENTWLFISNTPATVDLLCQGEREEIYLNNTSIIRLMDDCTIRTEKNILRSNINHEHKVEISFHKISATLNTTLPTDYVKQEIKYESVLGKSDQLYEKPLELPEPKKLPEMTKHTITASVSVIGSLTVGFIIFRLRKGIGKICKNLTRCLRKGSHETRDKDMELKQKESNINRKPQKSEISKSDG